MVNIRPHLPITSRATRAYHWVFGETFSEKHGRTIRVLLGPYSSNQQAESIGFAKLKGQYKVYELKTSDRSEASREIKHFIMEGGQSIEDSIERIQQKHSQDIQRE